MKKPKKSVCQTAWEIANAQMHHGSFIMNIDSIIHHQADTRYSSRHYQDPANLAGGDVKTETRKVVN